MTWRKRTIIEMAREADLIDDTSASDWYVYQLERFAALVREEALAQPEQGTVQRLSALVRAQQITIDKLEAQIEQPPQRQPLTVWEVELWAAKPINRVALCRAIEAAHGIKETT